MARDEGAGTQAPQDEGRSCGVQDKGTLSGTPWRKYAQSIMLALALALLGCGDGVPNLAGTWTGTIQDSLAGTGALLLTIGQRDTQLSGSWQSTFPDPANNNGGNLSGTVGDASIALVLSASRPGACSFTVAANRDDDRHFTGTYASFNCGRAQGGTLDVTRQ
jgi:hypothetical protein